MKEEFKNLPQKTRTIAIAVLMSTLLLVSFLSITFIFSAKSGLGNFGKMIAFFASLFVIAPLAASMALAVTLRVIRYRATRNLRELFALPEISLGNSLIGMLFSRDGASIPVRILIILFIAGFVSLLYAATR